MSGLHQPGKYLSPRRIWGSSRFWPSSVQVGSGPRAGTSPLLLDGAVGRGCCQCWSAGSAQKTAPGPPPAQPSLQPLPHLCLFTGRSEEGREEKGRSKQLATTMQVSAAQSWGLSHQKLFLAFLDNLFHIPLGKNNQSFCRRKLDKKKKSARSTSDPSAELPRPQTLLPTDAPPSGAAPDPEALLRWRVHARKSNAFFRLHRCARGKQGCPGRSTRWGESTITH